MVLVLLLTSALLAGCLGGDDDPAAESGDNGNGGPVEGTGSLTGRVFTIDLDIVTGARASLVDDGELIAEARSDEEGRFQIDNVEPGTYRLQVTATCCREAARGVEIVEGETTNVDLQLERFSAADLATPYVEEFEWTGFLACGYVVLIRAGDACQDLDDQAERTHPFELEPGIKTVTASLIWDSPGITGEELQYGMARLPCTQGTAGACSTPGDYYGYTVGTSPLELRIDEGDSTPSFEGLEETTDVQLRVFPPFSSDLDVYYNVEFTVYYQLHYNQPAPENFIATPDN